MRKKCILPMILTLIAVIPSSVNALSVIDRNIDYSSVNIDESNDIELSRGKR